MDKLVEDFRKSIFSNSFELVSDYIELGIDDFINNEKLNNN